MCYTGPMDTLTLPAFAAKTLGESITLHAPEDWHPRIKALAVHLVYGPLYSRHVLICLQDMSQQVEQGYSALAYDNLLAAERLADARKHPFP